MENPNQKPVNGIPDNKDNAVRPATPATPVSPALQTKIDMVADPVRNTVDKVSSVAHQTVDKLADQAASVAERFSGQSQWLSEAPNRTLESSKAWIKEKPLEAVGMALAFGYIWGRMKSN